MESPARDANGNLKDRSDLTQIRGIGAIRKRWLNSLGIYTIAELSQAAADAIDAQARSEGRSLSRDELEAWIAQAQVQHSQTSSEQAKPEQAKPSHAVEAIAPAINTQRLAVERTDKVPMLHVV